MLTNSSSPRIARRFFVTALGPLPILYGQLVLCHHSPHVVMKPLSLHWDEGVPYPQQQ